MNWILVLACFAMATFAVLKGIQKYKVDKSFKSIRKFVIGAVFFGVGGFIGLYVNLENSGKKIDFAEYLFPSKNLVVEERYGEVHTKSFWIVGWSDGSFIKKVETLAPADIRGTTEIKFNIESDGIYITSRSMLTGEVQKRKYAERELFVRKGTSVIINGGEYSVLELDQMIDSVVGKLSPCIMVKKENKRGYEKHTYCKNYGEMQSEMKYGKDEASVVKVISIK